MRRFPGESCAGGPYPVRDLYHFSCRGVLSQLYYRLVFLLLPLLPLLLAAVAYCSVARKDGFIVLQLQFVV